MMPARYQRTGFILADARLLPDFFIVADVAPSPVTEFLTNARLAARPI